MAFIVGTYPRCVQIIYNDNTVIMGFGRTWGASLHREDLYSETTPIKAIDFNS